MGDVSWKREVMKCEISKNSFYQQYREKKIDVLAEN